MGRDALAQNRTPKHAAHAKPSAEIEVGSGSRLGERRGKHAQPASTAYGDVLEERGVYGSDSTRELPHASHRDESPVRSRRRVGEAAQQPTQAHESPVRASQAGQPTQAYARPVYASQADQPTQAFAYQGQSIRDEQRTQAFARQSTGPYAPVTQVPDRSASQPYRNAAPIPDVAPIPDGADSGFAPDWNMQKKRGGRAKVVIAVIVALLLLLGAAAFWYVSSLNKKLADGADSAAIAALTPVADGEPFYALILGSDSREGSGTSDDEYESGDYERSDVMMLVRVDQKNRKLTIVSIPRDTPYQDEAGGWSKINECFNWGGAAASIKAVEDLTGVKISHYGSVRFSDLQSIVDRVGGVDVDVDIDLSYEDALTGEDVYLEAGRQHLDGQHAQLFARARKDYDEDQDEHRQENVRQLMVAVLEKVLEVPLPEMPGTIMDLAQYVSTDMEVGDFTSLATAFAGGEMTVYEASGPWDGDLNPLGWDLWMCYRNPEAWAKLMAAVDAGEDPEYVEDEYDATSILWPPSTAATEEESEGE